MNHPQAQCSSSVIHDVVVICLGSTWRVDEEAPIRSVAKWVELYKIVLDVGVKRGGGVQGDAQVPGGGHSPLQNELRDVVHQVGTDAVIGVYGAVHGQKLQRGSAGHLAGFAQGVAIRL